LSNRKEQGKVMATREIWFRNLFRFAPWSVFPVHWKGWALLILGPLVLVVGGLALADRPEIATVIGVSGALALFIAIYTHTTWDRN
jgi:hypothetical protein